VDELELLPFSDQAGLSGRAPLLLLLASLLVVFALTRLYTRLARVRGWGSGSAGGVHVHHMVVGIVLILVSGLVEIAIQPGGGGRELLAIAFGAGAAFTLDEFALWLHLRDVYWSAEGRSSIDATVMGVLLAGLLLVGSSPFGIEDDSHDPRAIAFGLIVLNVALAAVTLAKGKLMLSLVAVFVPVAGLVGAFRLAKPRSLWAKRFYDEQKVRRATARFEDPNAPLVRLHRRFADLVGGAPTGV
jgi:hypothetical protein